MPSTYTQTPIRLELDLISNPPVSPIDANTGLAPRAWRSQDVAVQIGIFDASQVPIDLTNLAYLQVILQNAQNAIVPAVVKTIASGSLTALIDRGSWDNGTAQNANVLFTAADMDQSLGAQASADWWLIILGVVAGTGQVIVYGAGTFTLYDAGTTIPLAPASGIFSTHALTNGGGDSTVTPLAQLHIETVTFTGVAGTRRLALLTTGLVAGAILTVQVLLPATTGIIVQLFNQSVGGTQLFAVMTDGFLRQATFRAYFDGANLQPLSADVPAY